MEHVRWALECTSRRVEQLQDGRLRARTGSTLEPILQHVLRWLPSAPEQQNTALSNRYRIRILLSRRADAHQEAELGCSSARAEVRHADSQADFREMNGPFQWCYKTTLDGC